MMLILFQQEKKKLPHALIVLNMSAEKQSSPRDDLELLLCGPWGRPKKKKLKYLVRPLGLHCFYADTPIIPR